MKGRFLSRNRPCHLKSLIHAMTGNRKQAVQFPEKEFVSGEQILCLGHHYILIVEMMNQNCSITPHIAQQEIHITISSFLNAEERKRIIKNALIEWYYTQAEHIINERVNYYSQLLDVSPNKIIIKEQKRRWGSCSMNGTLRFNWRAIMAPLSIIDYIVVHELCHLKIKNHSSDFWNLVSSLIPDYKKLRFWLKNNMGFFKI